MNIKYYKVNENELNSLPFNAGSIYFCKDTNKLYADPIGGGGVHTLINDNINDNDISDTSTWSSNKTSNEIKKSSPVNLLDNSNFMNPVNQRGQNSYNGIGYNIDRWRFWEEAGILAIHDGYVSFKSGALYQHCNINIDPNKKYTAAYMDMDGTLYILCGKPADNPYENNLNFYIENDILIFRIWNKNDNTETKIKWAALYEGEYTIDTLPEYRSKGYGAELSECQRYYIRFKLTFTPFAFGYTTDSANARAIIPTPSTMRIKPSISSQSNFYMRGGSKSVPLNNPIVYCILDNSVRIDFTGQDLPVSESIIIYSDGDFGLSADL